MAIAEDDSLPTFATSQSSCGTSVFAVEDDLLLTDRDVLGVNPGARCILDSGILDSGILVA